MLGERATHLGCLEIDQRPDEINFSSCFFSSLAFLHALFSAPCKLVFLALSFRDCTHRYQQGSRDRSLMPRYPAQSGL